MDINPRWLSLKSATQYASMSKPTLMEHVREGAIYGTLKGGKWYIDRESIDKFFLQDGFEAELIAQKIIDRGRKHT